MAGKGIGDAVGPIKTGINVGQTIAETLFTQTKPMFKDYWSGDIAKGVVNSDDGIFTSNFWTGKTTVFRYDGKKFYLKEGEPIMVVKKNDKVIGYAHAVDFFSGGLGTNKIYKSVAEVKNKYGSGLFDTVVGTAVDGFVHYGLPWMGKKAVEMGRYGASELMRNKNLQKKAVNYGINKLTPFIQDSVGSAMDQLSTKVRPKKKYKTNRPELDGKGVDIHKWIGKLPKPKAGWTPGSYKYMGPFNPLDKQLSFNPETGEVIEWKVKPYNKVDEIAAYHDICYDMGRPKGDCDKEMVKSLDNIPYGEMPKWGSTARFLINTKQKLGLGLNVKRR